MRIGVFDSGIGGLTVLNDLVSVHPKHEYIYVGDTLRNPYGDKDKETLKQYALEIIDFLISKKVDLIVIACGTLSSKIYHDIKDRYEIPIYDILSPMINFLNDSCYTNIGVMATSNTVFSHIFKNKLSNKNVVEIACPKLVPLIEKGLDVNDILPEYLNLLKDVEVVVLGCTHYPIIYEEIEDLSNKELLSLGKYLSNTIWLENETNKKITLYFTKIDDTLKANLKKIMQEKYELEELKL